MKDIKRFSNIVRIVVGTLVCAYVMFVLGLNIPWCRQKISLYLSETLSEKFGTDVEVGDVRITLFNRVVFYNVSVKDQYHADLLNARYVGARFVLSQLVNNKIVIDNLELFDTWCNTYRQTETSKANYQFIVDSLSSTSPHQKSSLDFMVRTLVVRNLNVKYDVLDRYRKSQGLDLSHLQLNGIHANLRLNKVAKDSLNLRIRELQFQEQSGFKLKHLQARIIAGTSTTRITGLKVETPYSVIETSSFIARNNGSGRLLDFAHSDFNDFVVNAKIHPSDFSSFLPSLKTFTNYRYQLKSTFLKRGSRLRMNLLLADSHDKESLNLKSALLVDVNSLFRHRLRLQADISDLCVASPQLRMIVQAAFGRHEVLPEKFFLLGTIRHRGRMTVDGVQIHVNGHTITDLGSVEEDVNYNLNHNKILANISLSDFNIAPLLQYQNLGKLSAQAKINGGLSPMDLKVETHVSSLEFNSYNYRNISFIGNCNNQSLKCTTAVNDPNAQLHAEGQYSTRGAHLLVAKLQLNHLSPQSLHLTSMFGDATLSGQASIHMSQAEGDYEGRLYVHRFKMSQGSDTQTFDSLAVNLSRNNGLMQTDIRSDMFDAQLRGNLKVLQLPAAFCNIMESQIPILRRHFLNSSPHHGYAGFDLRIKRSAFLENLFHLPFHVNGEAMLRGHLNTGDGNIHMTADIPSFTLFNNPYSGGTLYLSNVSDSLTLLAQVTKKFKSNRVKFVLNSHAHEGAILSQLEWKNIDAKGTQGYLKALASFSTVGIKGTNTHIHLFPSRILINDSVWHVNSSSFDFRPGLYRINDFIISHGRQYLALHSTPSEIANGRGLVADLKDIDLEYIFDLLNFHPVRFEGKASGRIETGNLSENKDVNARLVVDNFKFNTAPMGTLWLSSQWMANNKKIFIDAITRRSSQDSTLIRGNVDIANNSIDLNFNSVKTNLQLLNEYLDGIFDDLKGACSGRLRLYGPLDAMNLAGDEKIDTLSLKPKVLNTTYHIFGDSVHFRPDRVIFDGLTLHDAKRNTAALNGEVTHRALHDFSYNLRFSPHNFLVYDWKSNETTGFWGTVYADGRCKLWGNTSEVHVDMDVTPQKNTVFVYDSSKPEDAGTKDFIRFRNPVASVATADTTRSMANNEINDKVDLSTDAYLNFNINATPDANLVILTDRHSGDRMSLFGSGSIRATYFNKGNFQLYGNYVVDNGDYKITIQDIIHKNFHIKRGGTLQFNGNPFDGDIDLQGNYTVNAVSLSDLNLGNLTSNSASVDCILHFKGKAGQPQVTFDIDFPNVNAEEAQMVRNMISSQGDMNMQIIYLLSIGRFFTYDYSSIRSTTNQDQSTVAMKSLLANTLSGQLNSMLSNALHITNWTFGTNISTGRVGWSDMEVGGLLSGRLLNNRLLINGNFGYRDQTSYYTNDFVGDFNLRWLLNRSGTISLKAYSETNDRYFTRSSLVTNGAGILFQRDFDNIRTFFKSRPKEIDSKANPQTKPQGEK